MVKLPKLLLNTELKKFFRQAYFIVFCKNYKNITKNMLLLTNEKAFAAASEFIIWS